MKIAKKRIILYFVVGLTIITVFMASTYALFLLTMQSSKKQVITAGNLDLILEEDRSINISSAYPMADEVGIIQEEKYSFRLINRGTVKSNYRIKIVEVGTDNIDKSIIKYGLTKNGETTINYLSNIENGILDEGVIAANKTVFYYDLRLWICETVRDESLLYNKTFTCKIEIDVSQDLLIIDILDLDSAKPINETMFNYTNEGVSPTGESKVDATNGLYFTTDDDGVTYFYRGTVNNLVKFGEYKQDYYVYQYNNYDYVSLESCQMVNSDCSESNKVLKYKKGTPMYWRIIRINGDGTIRMIYSGTSPHAYSTDTLIGFSKFNKDATDPKYSAYTYDRTSSEIASLAKKEIDKWYLNNLSDTKYDELIEIGNFCSDSSGYLPMNFRGQTWQVFDSFRRTFASMFDLGNVTPTYHCAETNQTYGGRYELKAGLITLDEIIFAGGQATANKTYYLFNGSDTTSSAGEYFWTMTPAVYISGTINVGLVSSNGYADGEAANKNNVGLRPVINLKADTKFHNATDGSLKNPYSVVVE